MSVVAKEPLLALERISQRFTLDRGRELQVLKNVNVSINDREVVAFLGPSGCGKTTTLKIMAGLISPTEGEVFVHGKPLIGINTRLSLVFQSYALLPWYTVEQNIAIGLKVQKLSARQEKIRVNQVVEMVGLGGFEE